MVRLHGDRRGQGPTRFSVIVSLVALVRGMPQLGLEFPGPGRRGSSSTHGSSPWRPTGSRPHEVLCDRLLGCARPWDAPVRPRVPRTGPAWFVVNAWFVSL